VLETGPLSTAAIGLYRRAGYGEIPLYGKYVGESYSVCFAKPLR
jgi:ribosomal protein S18 acetylase RimI-like enzyme